jgi:hypothetical protein
MSEKIGIDKTKKLVHFACGLTKQIEEATEDGWQLADLFKFFDEAAEIPGVAKSLPEIKKEIEDMDPGERIELYEFVRDEFDLADDNLEFAIEKSLEFSIAGYQLWQMWRNLRAKKA